jgi:putative membrane protein
MDRRSSLKLAGGAGLTLLTASLAPTLAFAQNRNRDRDRDRDRPRLGEAEERHIRETLELGTVSLETSRLAKERARDSWVKKFAEYETAEQETVAEVLRTLGARLSQEAREDRRQARRDLREASGRGFEEAYLEVQAEGHDQLLRVQETYIRSGKDEHHLGIARLVRGQVKEHIDLIKTIRQQLRA